MWSRRPSGGGRRQCQPGREANYVKLVNNVFV